MMTDIEIRPLDASLAEAAFDLASRNFATQSALHVVLDARLDDYRAYLRPTFFDDVNDGLSLAATQAGTGDLVGVLIVRDFRKQRFAGHLPFQQLYDPVTALFETLEADYLQDRHLKTGEALLVDMAAVVPSHTGLGIYQTLRREISSRARSAGYKYIIGELTTAATQHVVVAKLGHRTCATIVPSDFVHAGRRPFASVTDPQTILLTEETL